MTLQIEIARGRPRHTGVNNSEGVWETRDLSENAFEIMLRSPVGTMLIDSF